MNTLIGDSQPDSNALRKMRSVTKQGVWYAYQNHDLGSEDLGHLMFLFCGPDSTFKEPPDKMPDTPSSINWRYVLVGKVNIENGKIEVI